MVDSRWRRWAGVKCEKKSEVCLERKLIRAHLGLVDFKKWGKMMEKE